MSNGRRRWDPLVIALCLVVGLVLFILLLRLTVVR